MSISINRVELLGRLAQVDDLVYHDDGTASLPATLVTHESWKDRQGQRQQHSESHRVVFTGRGAEVIQQYADLGQELLVEGVLRHRPDPDGKGTLTVVVVEDDQFTFGAKAWRSATPAVAKGTSGAQPGSTGRR